MAIRRIEDFAAVHSAADDDLLEALAILRESLGISDEMMNNLAEWAEIFLGDDVAAPLLLGLMLGLIAADHDRS
jgi:hypothetical protein